MSINPGFHDMGQHCECFNESNKWHKAGWEDGVRHERERSKVLAEALKVLFNPCTCNPVGPCECDGEIAKEALKKYEEMGNVGS